MQPLPDSIVASLLSDGKYFLTYLWISKHSVRSMISQQCPYKWPDTAAKQIQANGAAYAEAREQTQSHLCEPFQSYIDFLS